MHARRKDTVQSKKGLTSITIAFDATLNPGSAVNRGFYSVLGAVKKHRKTVYTKGVPLRGVSYNGNAQTVTITLAKPYKGAVQVKVLRLASGNQRCVEQWRLFDSRPVDRWPARVELIQRSDIRLRTGLGSPGAAQLTTKHTKYTKGEKCGWTRSIRTSG